MFSVILPKDRLSMMKDLLVRMADEMSTSDITIRTTSLQDAFLQIDKELMRRRNMSPQQILKAET